MWQRLLSRDVPQITWLYQHTHKERKYLKLSLNDLNTIRCRALTPKTLATFKNRKGDIWKRKSPNDRQYSKERKLIVLIKPFNPVASISTTPPVRKIYILIIPINNRKCILKIYYGWNSIKMLQRGRVGVIK